MNSNDPNFDWHRPGVWIASRPNILRPLFGTIGLTAHCTKMECARAYNQSWGELAAQGFFIQEYAPVIEHILRVQDQVVSDESRWRYPAAGDVAPQGVGLMILTQGRVQVSGVWRDGVGYIAWAPKIKRDKELEQQLGLL